GAAVAAGAARRHVDALRASQPAALGGRARPLLPDAPSEPARVRIHAPAAPGGCGAAELLRRALRGRLLEDLRAAPPPARRGPAAPAPAGMSPETTPAASSGLPHAPRASLVVFWDYDTAWGADRSREPGGPKSWGPLEFEHTERLLELHAEHGVPACFAVVGAAALPGERPYHDPGQIRRIAAAGHEIGSHSFRHEWLP